MICWEIKKKLFGIILNVPAYLKHCIKHLYCWTWFSASFFHFPGGNLFIWHYLMFLCCTVHLYMHQSCSVYPGIRPSYTRYKGCQFFWQFLVVFDVKMQNQWSYMFISLYLHLSDPLEEVWKLGVIALCANNFNRTQWMLMHKKTCMIPTICLVYDF